MDSEETSSAWGTPMGITVVDFNKHCDGLPSQRRRLLGLGGLATLPPEREPATPASLGLFTGLLMPSCAQRVAGLTPERTLSATKPGRAYGTRPLDVPAYTVCRRGLHFVGDDGREVSKAPRAVGVERSSLVRCRANVSRRLWAQMALVSLPVGGAFQSAFESAAFAAARKMSTEREASTLQKYVDNVYPPAMAEAVLRSALRRRSLPCAHILAIDLFAGISGAAMGALAVDPDATTHAYDYQGALGVLHEEVLQRATGGAELDRLRKTHTFTRVVLGPKDRVFRVDLGDGEGSKDHSGCGAAWLVEDIRARLCRDLTDRGLARVMVHVHVHGSPPCNAGHPCNSRSPDYRARRTACSANNRWTWNLLKELVARGLADSTSLENGAFAARTWWAT